MKLAAFAVAAALSAPPAAQAPIEAAYVEFPRGTSVDCTNPSGCIAMTPEVLADLLEQAARSGATAACRRTI